MRQGIDGSIDRTSVASIKRALERINVIPISEENTMTITTGDVPEGEGFDFSGPTFVPSGIQVNFEKLQKIKPQIDHVNATDNEKEELKQAFDNVLAELFLRDLQSWPAKEQRNPLESTYFNSVAGVYFAGGQRLPFFVEDSRQKFRMQAAEILAQKGIVEPAEHAS
jgi:hypothetical protein